MVLLQGLYPRQAGKFWRPGQSHDHLSGITVSLPTSYMGAILIPFLSLHQSQAEKVTQGTWIRQSASRPPRLMQLSVWVGILLELGAGMQGRILIWIPPPRCGPRL